MFPKGTYFQKHFTEMRPVIESNLFKNGKDVWMSDTNKDEVKNAEKICLKKEITHFLEN